MEYGTIGYARDIKEKRESISFTIDPIGMYALSLETDDTIEYLIVFVGTGMEKSDGDTKKIGDMFSMPLSTRFECHNTSIKLSDNMLYRFIMTEEDANYAKNQLRIKDYNARISNILVWIS